MKKRLLICMMVGLLGVAHAAPKVATCKITLGNEIAYKGKCLFDPYEGGSFTLKPIKGEALFDEITLIDVYITSQRRAEVKSHTLHETLGKFSMSIDGSAVRSKSQPACWNGSYFQICAW